MQTRCSAKSGRTAVRSRRSLGWAAFGLASLALALATGCVSQSTVSPLAKLDPHDIRVVEYNNARNFIAKPEADATFNRIFTALQPDVIVSEEFPPDVTKQDVIDRLNAILPTEGGWHVHFGKLGGIRTVVASRYPLKMTRDDTDPPASTRGVAIALVDLPDADYLQDLYVLGVHLKCCGSPGGKEDESRQASADAIANWLGDARGVSRPAGDKVVLAADTPVLVIGDFNMVGGPQPEQTFLTGDIQDESKYGSDVKGDWDNTDLTDLKPADKYTGDTFTWQGSSRFPPSALDRVFYTDSVTLIANSFVLNTNTMPAEDLAAAGLEKTDTLWDNASDHLPVVVDLRIDRLN